VQNRLVARGIQSDTHRPPLLARVAFSVFVDAALIDGFVRPYEV
jgi:hypothetical protein